MAPIVSTITRPGRVIMTKLEKTLFCLLIFLIPSNLAYHVKSFQFLVFSFQFNNAVVDGILVDYLIPKIYLTDILILSLFLLWIIPNFRLVSHRVQSLFKNAQIQNSFFHFFTHYFLVFIFFAWTLAQIPFSLYPLAAFWFWLKLIEMGLFVLCLRSLPRPFILHTLYFILPLSVLWQSALAWAQWFKQGNIFPYWFLGESQFSALTPGIAKASFFGALKVLPLGTTPHPNVLGGFLVISLIILITLKKFAVTAKFKTIPLSSTNALAMHARRAWEQVSLVAGSYYITLIFGISTLLITQSLTSVFILGLFAIYMSLSNQISNYYLKLLIISMVIFASFWGFTHQSSILEYTSLSRRAKLNQIALTIIQNRPFGVGLNNFTAVMNQYGYVEATYRFFQPVHNIYLLLWTETGLIGFVIVILLVVKYTINPLILRGRKRQNQPSADHRKILWGQFSIPLIAILIIGLADHYPLTLQTGQLLTTLSIGLISPASNTKPTS